MRFSEYYTEAQITKGDVITLPGDKKQWIVVDIDGDDIELLDYETKTKSKTVSFDDVIAIQQDMFGGKASTDKKEKPKKIPAPKPKEVKTQISLLMKFTTISYFQKI